MTHLNPLSLQCLAFVKVAEKAKKDFELESPHGQNHKRAVSLWKYAVRILTNAYGEAGIMALNFLRMVSYLRVKRFNIRIFKFVPNLLQSIVILEYNQLLTFENLRNDQRKGYLVGYITLHSLDLLTAIRQINKYTGIEKIFVKECVKYADLRGMNKEYCSLWSFGFKYTHLLWESHCQNKFYDDLRKNKRPSQKYVRFLERSIRVYAREFGEGNSETAMLKVTWLTVLTNSVDMHSSMESKLCHWKETTRNVMNLEKLVETVCSCFWFPSEIELTKLAMTLYKHTRTYEMSSNVKKEYLEETINLAKLVLQHGKKGWIKNLPRLYLILYESLIDLGQLEMIPQLLYDCYGEILFHRSCLSLVDREAKGHLWIRLCERVLETAGRLPNSLPLICEILPILDEIKSYNLMEPGYDIMACTYLSKAHHLQKYCLQQLEMTEEIEETVKKYYRKMGEIAFS